MGEEAPDLSKEAVQRAFGANVRKIREAKGWAAPELARRMQAAGTGRYLYRIEQGLACPRLDLAASIARGLGVTVDELLVDPGDPKSPEDKDLGEQEPQVPQ